jgi:hypothetical protein
VWALLLSVPVLVLLACFVGGILAAAVECRKERRATGTVTRPGWERLRRLREQPCYCAEGYVCTYCTPDPSPLARFPRRLL